MTDPLSISVASLTLVSAAIASSRELIELINSMRLAPNEITTMSRDLQAFQTVLLSMEAVLRDLTKANIVVQDPTIINMIQTLDAPMENCRRLVSQVTTRIKSAQNTGRNSRFRTLPQLFRWELYVKHEVRELRRYLQESKSTLSTANGIVTLLCVWQLLAKTSIDTGSSTGLYHQLPDSASRAGEIAAIQPPVTDSLYLPGAKPGCTQNLAQRQCRPHFINQSTTDTQFTGTLTRNLVKQLVCETRNAFVADNSAMSKNIAQIYQILAKQGAQLEALASDLKEPKGEDESSNQAENSYAADVFFDCVSRFSGQDTESSIASSRESFLGSPDYWFEQGSSYFPELYLSGVLHERLFLTALVESEVGFHTIECFILYAAAPRRWHRIHMHAVIEEKTKTTMISRRTGPDNVDVRVQYVPEALQELLPSLLSDTELFDPVTSLQVSMTQRDGKLNYDPYSVKAAEDFQESALMQEQLVLKELKELGCREYRESNVVTISRLMAARFLVRVGFRLCVEQKAPFVHAGQRLENAFHYFTSRLIKLHSLKDCSGVSKLIGIVVDEDGRHLKSYLCEATFVSLDKALATACTRRQNIPWSLRKFWAKQLIRTVSRIHRRKIVIGRLQCSIREDASIVFFNFWNSVRNFESEKGGIVPPEFRDPDGLNVANDSRPFTFSSDIFQLGFILWQLVELAPPYSGPRFCIAAECPQTPRYTCTSRHRNPVQLPFTQETDPLLQEIVKRCRSAEPEERPTAQELAEMVADVEDDERLPSAIQDFPAAFAGVGLHFWVHCDECGNACSEEHYRCYRCSNGTSFDFCLPCVRRGMRCWDPQHRLWRRVLKDGVLVEEI